MTMVPALSATPRVLKALRQILLNDDTLTARLSTAPANLGGGPAIYTEGYVPAAARTDYLTIGAFTETPDNAMGDGAKWGATLTAQIKLVTQSMDVGYSLGTIDRVIALLGGVWLTVDDYSAGSSELDVTVPALQELMAGQQYMHYPVIFRIRVHQPT